MSNSLVENLLEASKIKTSKTPHYRIEVKSGSLEFKGKESQ